MISQTDIGILNALGVWLHRLIMKTLLPNDPIVCYLLFDPSTTNTIPFWNLKCALCWMVLIGWWIHCILSTGYEKRISAVSFNFPFERSHFVRSSFWIRNIFGNCSWKSFAHIYNICEKCQRIPRALECLVSLSFSLSLCLPRFLSQRFIFLHKMLKHLILLSLLFVFLFSFVHFQFRDGRIFVFRVCFVHFSMRNGH